MREIDLLDELNKRGLPKKRARACLMFFPIHKGIRVILRGDGWPDDLTKDENIEYVEVSDD